MPFIEIMNLETYSRYIRAITLYTRLIPLRTPNAKGSRSTNSGNSLESDSKLCYVRLVVNEGNWLVAWHSALNMLKRLRR